MTQTATIGGIITEFDVSGSGSQPVIIMHGWGCRASTVAVLAESALGAETTVYNLDLPGFGGSSEPPVVWGIDDYTRWLSEFIDHFNLENPVLIGHSFGGRMAINYAADHEVTKVILVDAAGIKPRRSLKYYIKVYSFKTARKVLPFIIGSTRASRIIDRWRNRSASADYKAASPRMRAILSRVVNEDLTGRLPMIKSPTLLIWGGKDTATPLNDAKKMERLIPDAGLVCYPEAGHYSFLERPAQTRAVIRNFLNLKN